MEQSSERAKSAAIIRTYLDVAPRTDVGHTALGLAVRENLQVAAALADFRRAHRLTYVHARVPIWGIWRASPTTCRGSAGRAGERSKPAVMKRSGAALIRCDRQFSGGFR